MNYNDICLNAEKVKNVIDRLYEPSLFLRQN